MVEEPTPEQRLITDTTNFAQTLLVTGCPIEFILAQSFRYALVEQRYQDEVEEASKGIYDSKFHLETPGTMLMAAEVLAHVITALEIHPDQVKSDHPYYNHHLVERYP